MAARQSVSPVWMRSYIEAMLEGLQTLPADPILETPSVRLFKADINPSPTDVLATYTAGIADFTGYASVSPTPPSIVVAPGSQTLALYLPALFAQTDIAITNTVYGYYVAQGAVLVLAERFPVGQQVLFNSALAYLDLAVLAALPFYVTVG